jgi:hypothetical protein
MAAGATLTMATPTGIIHIQMPIPIQILIHTRRLRVSVQRPQKGSCLQAGGARFYLIKLTYGSNICEVQRYWYTAGTLNFITLQGELKKTPISSIDRAATCQLNQNYGVNFQLPT